MLFAPCKQSSGGCATVRLGVLVVQGKPGRPWNPPSQGVTLTPATSGKPAVRYTGLMRACTTGVRQQTGSPLIHKDPFPGKLRPQNGYQSQFLAVELERIIYKVYGSRIWVSYLTVQVGPASWIQNPVVDTCTNRNSLPSRTLTVLCLIPRPNTRWCVRC